MSFLTFGHTLRIQVGVAKGFLNTCFMANYLMVTSSKFSSIFPPNFDSDIRVIFNQINANCTASTKATIGLRP